MCALGAQRSYRSAADEAFYISTGPAWFGLTTPICRCGWDVLARHGTAPRSNRIAER